MRPITDRQRAVVEGIALGLSYKEIGTRLGIAERTVKQHADACRYKLRVPVARKLPEALRAHDAETTSEEVARSAGRSTGEDEPSC